MQSGRAGRRTSPRWYRQRTINSSPKLRQSKLPRDNQNENPATVNGAAIFLKSGAGKFPQSGGLAISRGRDQLLRFLGRVAR